MIETHGLNHISLSVRDIDVALAFYVKLFGVREYFRDESSVQVLGPGKQDVIAFERRDHRDDRGGVHHFGFRLTSPNGIDRVVSEAVAAGGQDPFAGRTWPGPALRLRGRPRRKRNRTLVRDRRVRRTVLIPCSL